jgi:hypothetical protein
VIRRGLAPSLAILGAFIAGCASSSSHETDAPAASTAPIPETYDQIAARYNARVERLDRIWARAVVVIKYRDAENRRRTEQGEGHFQFLAPSQLALSVGKLGEIIAWLGCDSTRFWFFERADADRVSIARHENIGRPCAQDGGVPCNPLDIIDLLGVTPIPDSGGVVSWSADGRRLVVEVPARHGRRLLTIAPGADEPTRIVLMPPTGAGATPLVVAELTNYTNVAISGSGAIAPRAPGRTIISLPDTGDEIRIALADLSDGAVAGRLNPDAFDLEFLLDVFTPATVTILDRACEQPALPPGMARP